MSEVLEPSLASVSFELMLGALADPVRLAFVRALDQAGDWVCGSDVLKEAGLTIGKSTLSHHIKVLRTAGLIHTRVDGKRRLVVLRQEELEQRFPGLLGLVRDRVVSSPAG